MTTTAENEIATDLQFGPPGFARLALRGRLNARTTATCWNRLEQGLRGARLERLDVDANGLQVCDGAGLALLRYLNMGKMTPGATVSVTGLEAGREQLFQAFTVEDYETLRPPSRVKCHSLPAEVGGAVRLAAVDLRQQVEFLGNVMANFLPTLMNRQQIRWPEVARIFETAGANAIPIISLVSVLVGLIIAFESAQPLAQFGAQIYVVNMIGLVMVRELGPLLAAILLAGRSGSAFAAEIGTMKVNEELDALHTFGIEPIRFLVIQRITAAVLLTPLLAFYATSLGILGGSFVALGLGYPLSLIFHQLSAAIDLRDIALNVVKGIVFGVIVSAVGCLRGFQTRQGPSAVGVSTTRAVVSSIVLIVIADAILAVIFFSLTQ